MRIEKKAWPAYFQAILDGRKTFDLRLADFAVEPGDTLHLREWDPETEGYTGRELTRQVGYVLRTRDCAFWSAEELAAHGLQVLALAAPDTVAEKPAKAAEGPEPTQ